IGSEFEGVIGCRKAAVDCGVDEEFADFVLGDAIVDGAAEMQQEFFIAIESDRHRQREQTTGVERKTWARPDFAPSITTHEILKWRAEFVGRLRGAINMSFAENFAADFHSLFVTFAIVHRPAPWI